MFSIIAIIFYWFARCDIKALYIVRRHVVSSSSVSVSIHSVARCLALAHVVFESSGKCMQSNTKDRLLSV